MRKYKVQITKKNFDDFILYYNESKEYVEDALEQFQKELPARTMHSRESSPMDIAKRMFNRHFMGRDNWRNIFSLEDTENRKLKMLVDYCADNNILWHVDIETEHYLLVTMSGTSMFWDKRFCTMEALPDYEALTMNEVRAKLITDITEGMLPAEMNALSINSVNEEKDNLSAAKGELQKLKDDVNYARTEELQKMEEEIQKLQDVMRARKQELLAELNEKISEMNEKIDKLNNQIYMMESEIYTIRSYSGETIEFKKVRDGNKAVPDTPLIVNQKLMYLDEDLARIVSIYQTEIAKKYDMFEDAVKYSDDVFESFCPQERCIAFFRLSKNATYKWFDAEKSMYQTEDLIHGKKIGFILRDSDCAYMGWMDEAWRINAAGDPVPVTFTEDLMYRPDKEVVITDAEDAEHGLKNDSKNDMLSRVFAMSVVQGILDNKGLLEFPEKVSIMKPGRYITYNYAAGWIMDDRFGDFATLVENLNKRTKVKDVILVCYNKHCCKGRGEVDRAWDTKVPEGINKVNYLDSDEYGHCNIYVSAKKSFSTCGATANVLVYKNEYINITYMNSIWLSYYVQTKKMGAYAEDYAKMIKHFKRAIEILKEREAEEIAYIKKYFPEADQIPEWEIKLSHWKLNHNIRFINDFQAKRIAKYLQEGRFEENKNLFEKENFYRNDCTADGKYTRTQFGWVSGWSNSKDAGEFEKGSPYYMQSFYVSNLNTSSWGLSKEQKEENAVKIAAELPKLEAVVPERLKQDEKKLALVNTYVSEYMNKHNVSVKDLQECPLGLNFEDGKLNFIRIEELSSSDRNIIFNALASASAYPEYILKSECWKVAYYDFVHKQYDKILHDMKMVLHEQFMNDTVEVN